MCSQNWRVRAVMPFAFALLGCRVLDVSAQAPASVGIPGNYQSEAGCAGDWDPACPATQLVYDANGDIWRNTFSITPAGAYEYKVALNGSWDVNYGLHALAERPEHSAGHHRLAAKRHLLLRPQDPLGHRKRQLHHCDRARQLPERNRLQRRLGSGLLPLLAAGHPGHGYLQLQHQRHSRRLLRSQGRAQRQLGRELRPGRRAERAEHRVHGAGQWHGSRVPVELHHQGSADHCRRHPRRSHQGAGVLAVGRHHCLERAHRYRGRAVRGSGRRAHARWPRHRRRAELEILDARRTIRRACPPRCARSFRTSRTSRRSSCRPTRSRPPRRA